MARKSSTRLFTQPGLLALVLSITLVACNSNDDDDGAGETSTGETGTTAVDGNPGGSTNGDTGMTPDDDAADSGVNGDDGMTPVDDATDSGMTSDDGMTPDDDAADGGMTSDDGMTPDDDAADAGMTGDDGMTPVDDAADDGMTVDDGMTPDDDAADGGMTGDDGMTPDDNDATGIGVPTGDDATAFTQGVVTAANPIAAEAGAQVLRDGGNAVDAAVVVQFVLNVVEATSSGIGGGGFMGLYRPETGRTIFIDSREKAPASATPTQYLDCDPNCTGEETRDNVLGSFTDLATSGIAVGVPGTLLGAAHALEQYGTISLADALAPAIKLAEEGFAINERLAMLTESDRTTFWPETASKFRTADGEPLSAGFMLVQPDLAKTFRLIADQGTEVFYKGEIADAIFNAQLRARGTIGESAVGRMTKADLAAYYDAGVDEREPIVSDYRGYTLNGMPPPSSGGMTVAQILECVEQFPLGDAEQGYGPGSTKTLHVMIESMRLAFSSRSVWMGDTDFVDLPVDGLTNADYLAPRCAQISADSRIADEAVVPGDPRDFDEAFAGGDGDRISSALDGPGGVDTTHFSVIDANGNVVSWTSTIEGTWGSGITVPGYGFLLNNELTDFNFIPQAIDTADDFKPGANDVAPGKRPRSSMAPVLVFKDDDFIAAYGSPGGSTIINSVVNITVNLVDHGMSIQEAIDAPRISSGGGTVTYEAFDNEALEGLRTLGHTLRDEPRDIGSVQAVVVDPATGMQYGGADDRRVGTVVGLPTP